jgi:hypothetical protein
MAVEPLAGRRIVKVTERKTKKDYTRFMKGVAAAYPEAEKIIVVQDNLNTHNHFMKPVRPRKHSPCHSVFKWSIHPRKPVG